jgi:AraC-like DNA-binding protein
LVQLTPSFSTDSLPPLDRFDYWCEVRAKKLSGVTLWVKPEDRPKFYGRLSTAMVGDVSLIEMEASSYHMTRSAADVARVTGNSLCIAEQVRGGGWMDTGRNGVHLFSDGNMAVSHSDMPYTAAPKRNDGFHYRTVRIPLADREAMSASSQQLSSQPFLKSSHLTRLIRASFAALFDDTLTTDTDIQHLAQLALLARDRVMPGAPETRAALRDGYFKAANYAIRRALHRPDLSAALIAGTLGISVRQLHILFEPSGLSFARTVTAMRVAKAHRLLTTSRERQIADIAYASGFDSTATFYRAFRKAYDARPGDIRMMANNPDALTSPAA